MVSLGELASRVHQKTQTGCIMDEEIYGTAFWASAGSTSFISYRQGLYKAVLLHHRIQTVYIP